MRNPRAVTSLRALAAAAMFAVSATSLRAQAVLPPAEPTKRPLQVLSDTRANWLDGGAESPNGRFFLLDPFAGDTLFSYDRTTRRWTSLPDMMLGGSMSWSPSGRFVVSWKTVSGRQSVMLTPMDTTTGRPSGPSRRISARVGRWPVWSPSGDRIAFVSNDSGAFKVVAVPFNGGEEVVLFQGPGGLTGGLAWSPDGKSILFGYLTAGRPAAWHRVDVATRAIATHPVSGAGILLGYSADGKRFAEIDRTSGALTVYSSSDWRILTRQQVGQRVTPTAWSKSDPNSLVGIEHIVPTHFQQATFPDGVVTSLMPPDSLEVRTPVYSPDGTQVAFVGAAGPFMQIRVMARSGGASRALGTPGVIDRPHWSPSGRSIAYCNFQSVHVIDLATGRDRELVRTATPAQNAVLACRWRADGAALRYLRVPGVALDGTRELREVSMAGEDRLLLRLNDSSGVTAQQVAAGAVSTQLLDDTLLVVQSLSRISLKNLRTSAERVLYTGSVFTREVGRSPDGRSLAFGVREGRNTIPHVVDLSGGDVRRVSYALGGIVNEFKFHPDGRHLVFSACPSCADPQGTEKFEIVIAPLNGDPARVVTAAQRGYRDYGRPDVAPDGRTIVFQGETSYNTRIVRIPVN